MEEVGSLIARIDSALTSDEWDTFQTTSQSRREPARTSVLASGAGGPPSWHVESIVESIAAVQPADGGEDGERVDHSHGGPVAATPTEVPHVAGRVQHRPPPLPPQQQLLQPPPQLGSSLDEARRLMASVEAARKVRQEERRAWLHYQYRQLDSLGVGVGGGDGSGGARVGQEEAGVGEQTAATAAEMSPTERKDDHVDVVVAAPAVDSAPPMEAAATSTRGPHVAAAKASAALALLLPTQQDKLQGQGQDRRQQQQEEQVKSSSSSSSSSSLAAAAEEAQTAAGAQEEEAAVTAAIKATGPDSSHLTAAATFLGERSCVQEMATRRPPGSCVAARVTFSPHGVGSSAGTTVEALEAHNGQLQAHNGQLQQANAQLLQQNAALRAELNRCQWRTTRNELVRHPARAPVQLGAARQHAQQLSELCSELREELLAARSGSVLGAEAEAEAAATVEVKAAIAVAAEVAADEAVAAVGMAQPVEDSDDCDKLRAVAATLAEKGRMIEERRNEVEQRMGLVAELHQPGGERMRRESVRLLFALRL
jgi:hypothetical protein